MSDSSAVREKSTRGTVGSVKNVVLRSRRSAVLVRLVRAGAGLSSIRPATSRRAANNRRARSPWTKTTTMIGGTTSTPSSSRASTPNSNSASIRWTLTAACRQPRCPGLPSVPAGAGDWRCLLCGLRPALPRSSTRVRCPFDGPPSHPCLQSRAAWRDPSMQIRDLPWPRCPPSAPGAPVPLPRRFAQRAQPAATEVPLMKWRAAGSY
jgi:hypothetical protein